MDTLVEAFTVTAIPSTMVEAVRTTLHDGYGNDLTAQLDDGGAPCRHCLRLTRAGERVLLFSYRPFERACSYQEIGPVFVHADGCERFDAAGMPEDFRRRPLVLRPYDREDRICAEQRWVAAGNATDSIEEMLAAPEVAYIHARSVTRGCYLFRIDRRQTPD